MKKSERHRLILQMMQNASSDMLLSTKELATQFDVSETTIRRDFQELSHAGLIQRQYGGAHSVKPSSNATQLGQVGILLGSRIDKYSDPFYNLVLQGADKKLGELGYHVAYIKTFYDVGTEEQARELLETFDVDGIILLGSSQYNSIQYLRNHFSPIVFVTDMYRIEGDLILFDGEQGMYYIIEHLAQMGYRRPAYISGQEDVRYTGFKRAVREFDLEYIDDLYLILTPDPSGWTPSLGERGTKMIMSKSIKPDVVVCASDRLAIGAMQWLQRNGYRIPEDIAVTGFDNIPDAEFTFPPLTTVNVHKSLLGELAAERIVRRIENLDEVYLHIIVPTSLVVRQSCRKIV
jgi:LacI family transcriptional regulator